jgi:hypothetical protein
MMPRNHNPRELLEGIAEHFKAQSTKEFLRDMAKRGVGNLGAVLSDKPTSDDLCAAMTTKQTRATRPDIDRMLSRVRMKTKR